ncbi:MAG: helix-turn-helix domain-containing protein [Rhodospirillales bacterium]|nr:helix-turn-helix domain-containing protein [Rhodospirillales bacterium]
MTTGAAYAIGDLARQTGTKVETIRWYERDGIMPAPVRTAGGHRLYTQAHLDRLAFIRHARELGFPLDGVRGLLRLADDPERPCGEADTIARAHLAAVQGRIARLQALEAELSRMIAACGRGRVAECRIIEVLADQSHTHCLHDGHGGTGL